MIGKVQSLFHDLGRQLARGADEKDTDAPPHEVTDTPNCCLGSLEPTRAHSPKASEVLTYPSIAETKKAAV